MVNVDRDSSAFALISHLTGLLTLSYGDRRSVADLVADIEVIGLLQRTSTGGLPDPFAVVYIDEETLWESEAQFRNPTPHWDVDLRL
jgi:hypothetical protein